MKNLNDSKKALLILTVGVLGALIIFIWKGDYVSSLPSFILPAWINSLGNALITLLFIVFIFLIIREAFTWYWKLNKIVKLLEKIENNTNPDRDLLEQNKVTLRVTKNS